MCSAVQRKRRRAGRPHAGRRQDRRHVAEPEILQPLTKGRVVAIAGVDQDHPARHHRIGRARANLVQRDLRLGAEIDLLRDLRLGPPRPVRRPRLGQIKPPRDRQARLMGGQRQADRHLAVVLFAQLAAVLARHADRMPSLLGKARVVHDPGLDRAARRQRRQHRGPHRRKKRLRRPRRLTDEVQQRLVLRAHRPRCKTRRHRLHALAPAGKQKPGAIVSERLLSILVPEMPAELVDIAVKASRKRAIAPLKIHRYPHIKRESSFLTQDMLKNTRISATFCDSVKLEHDSN